MKLVAARQGPHDLRIEGLDDGLVGDPPDDDVAREEQPDAAFNLQRLMGQLTAARRRGAP